MQQTIHESLNDVVSFLETRQARRQESALATANPSELRPELEEISIWNATDGFCGCGCACGCGCGS